MEKRYFVFDKYFINIIIYKIYKMVLEDDQISNKNPCCRNSIYNFKLTLQIGFIASFLDRLKICNSQLC